MEKNRMLFARRSSSSSLFSFWATNIKIGSKSDRFAIMHIISRWTLLPALLLMIISISRIDAYMNSYSRTIDESLGTASKIASNQSFPSPSLPSSISNRIVTNVSDLKRNFSASTIATNAIINNRTDNVQLPFSSLRPIKSTPRPSSPPPPPPLASSSLPSSSSLVSPFSNQLHSKVQVVIDDNNRIRLENLPAMVSNYHREPIPNNQFSRRYQIVEDRDHPFHFDGNQNYFNRHHRMDADHNENYYGPWQRSMNDDESGRTPLDVMFNEILHQNEFESTRFNSQNDRDKKTNNSSSTFDSFTMIPKKNATEKDHNGESKNSKSTEKFNQNLGEDDRSLRYTQVFESPPRYLMPKIVRPSFSKIPDEFLQQSLEHSDMNDFGRNKIDNDFNQFNQNQNHHHYQGDNRKNYFEDHSSNHRLFDDHHQHHHHRSNHKSDNHDRKKNHSLEKHHQKHNSILSTDSSSAPVFDEEKNRSSFIDKNDPDSKPLIVPIGSRVHFIKYKDYERPQSTKLISKFDYSNDEPYEPSVIELPSSQPVLPIVFNFRTKSSPIYTKTTHRPMFASQPIQFHGSEDPPHLRHHTVHKPVIQDLHEIILPYRVFVQEMPPVNQFTDTILESPLPDSKPYNDHDRYNDHHHPLPLPPPLPNHHHHHHRDRHPKNSQLPEKDFNEYNHHHPHQQHSNAFNDNLFDQFDGQYADPTPIMMDKIPIYAPADLADEFQKSYNSEQQQKQTSSSLMESEKSSTKPQRLLPVYVEDPPRPTTTFDWSLETNAFQQPNNPFVGYHFHQPHHTESYFHQDFSRIPRYLQENHFNHRMK
ncbi:hypothetical protein NH340_JMT02153 [Sarcoptes scabiei]|nr:hypothetical protein NH340_JMT02153 [Sarcoptes scabiei]